MFPTKHQAPTRHETVDTPEAERGASLVEYALLLALIAVVCISAVTFLGKTASTKLGGAGSSIQDGGGKGGLRCPPGWHLVDQNHDKVLVCQP